MSDSASTEMSPAPPVAAPTELDPPSRLQLLLCRECFRRRDELRAAEAARPTVDVDPANVEGVDTLLGLATDAVDDERNRGRALDTKTASLAGFTGLVLSVNVTLGRALLAARLGRVGDRLVDAFFGVAIACLTLGLALALFGVLMPQKYRGLGREQLRAFARADVQSRPKLWVQQSMLGALADILDQDRPVNDCKAKLTKRVGGALLIGFLAVAAQAITLVVHDLGI